MASVTIEGIEGVQDFDYVEIHVGDEESHALRVNDTFACDAGDDDVVAIHVFDHEGKEIDVSHTELKPGLSEVELSTSGGRVTLNIEIDAPQAGADGDGFALVDGEDEVDVEEEDIFVSSAPPPATQNFETDEESQSSEEHQQDFLAHPSGNHQFETDEDEDSHDGEGSVEEGSSEPTPLMLWQVKHNEELMEKAAAERHHREEIRGEAKEWLQKFYADRDNRITNQAKMNEHHQNTLQEQIVFNLGQGSVWERTTNLVDMKSSRSKKGDVARMRSILLQVKNHTPEHLARHDQAQAVGSGRGAHGSSGDWI